MTRRQSISRWSVAAGIVVLQIVSLSIILGQTDRRSFERRPIPSPAATVQLQQTLIRARATLAARSFAEAYAEFREALRLAPPNGPQHEEALNGFVESGIGLARQRLAEGRAGEAQNIAREILKERPNYQPALELLGQRRMRGFTATEPGGRSEPGSTGRRAPETSAPRATPEMESPEPTGGGIERSRHKAMARKKEEATISAPHAPASTQPPAGPEEFPAEGREATPPPKEKRVLVPVYFATDRLPAGTQGPSNYFGVEWNKSGDHLVTGVVTVSIPPIHQEGSVERPKWYKLEFSEDPAKHFVLRKLKLMGDSDFYDALRREYDTREPEKRSAFVFIHGFNVTFDDAAYRTAQLAADLHFEGVPIMYSWPSQGRLLAYDADLETVNDFSSQNFQHFLERIAHETGALRINLIAHSMGNVLLVNSLRAIAQQPDIQPLFENVIMAAPDVNAQSFTLVWPEVKKAAKHFTLYASSDDQALVASKRQKSGFTRLGEAGPKIVVISGLDTVDATGIDTSLLGHSYVDSCKPVMTDLQLIIERGLAPLERKLRNRYKEGLAYWAFP